MMKKLVATVFALSLTALGCGSDNGTPPKTDASPDLKGVEVQPPPTDVPIAGPEAGPEAQPDLKKLDVVMPPDQAQPVQVTYQDRRLSPPNRLIRICERR